MALDLTRLNALGRVGQTLGVLLEHERVPPSMLFEGADEAALAEAARTFAATLLASEGTSAAASTRIEGRVLSGDHPDVEVQTRDKATVISVAALSALLSRAHQTPLEAERRVFIIHPADAMDPGGIARYLKVLEEPPRHAVFILATTHPDRLPDAVRSRCQRFRFPPLAEGVIAERLAAHEGIDPEHAARVSELASGSWSLALRLAHDETLPCLDALLACAHNTGRDAVGVVDGVITRLEAAAKERAEALDEATRQKSFLRDMMADMLHALCVYVRDAMHSTSPRLPAWISEAEAPALFVRLGALATDVRRNVSPRVLLLALLDDLAGPR